MKITPLLIFLNIILRHMELFGIKPLEICVEPLPLGQKNYKASVEPLIIIVCALAK